MMQPETICVRLLRKCTLSCGHCWAESSPLQTEELASGELVRFLRELRRRGLKHVSLSGGEPFLYGELSEVVRACLEEGLFVTVTTNGFMGSRFGELADRRHFPSHPHLRIRVSIDGTAGAHDRIRGTGTFALAVACLGAVKARQGWVGVNTVLVPSVYTSLEGLLPQLRGQAVDDWALIAPLPKGRHRGQGMDSHSVRTVALQMVSSAGRLGFHGRVRFWDFHVREHGHLVLESDGRVLMPGFLEETDRIVGDYRRVDLEHLTRAVAEDAGAHPLEFYSWGGWSRGSNRIPTAKTEGLRARTVSD